MAKLMRCKAADLSVRVTATGLAKRIGAGLVVDFDEVLSPGFTLGDALEGRHEAFEPAEPPAAPVVAPVWHESAHEAPEQ